MLVRAIYDPKGAWDAHSFEVEAPDFTSAIADIDFPKEFQDGDLLVQEFRKGGPYNWFQFQGGQMVQVDPATLRKDPPACTKCNLCTKALNVKIPHTWAKKWKAERPLVMVIGMAPGREEDIDNSCFVPTAPAGGMMRTLVKEAGIEDHEVVYSNIVKCFPTGDHGEMRDPLPEELTACSPYILEEIADLDPAIIVVCGSVAANFLLGTTGDKITKMRGRVFKIKVEGKEYKVVPIIHPSAAVRGSNQAYMNFIREDLRNAKNVATARAEMPAWHLINDTEDAILLLWKIKSLFDRKLIPGVALDIENNSRIHLDTDEEEFVSMDLWDPTKRILGVSLAWDDHNGYFIPLFHRESKVDVGTFLNVFKQIFAVEYQGEPVARIDEAVPLICWNGRHDQSWFYVKHGIKTKLLFDGMLGSYCVYTSTRKHSLKRALAEVYFWPDYDTPLYDYLREHHKKDADYERLDLLPDPTRNMPGLSEYACYDATGTWKIRQHFLGLMDDGLRNVHDLLCNLSDYLVENESRCTVVDVAHLEKTEREYPLQMASLLMGLGTLPAVQRFLAKNKGRYNPNAPDQARTMLFGYAICKGKVKSDILGPDGQPMENECGFHSHSPEYSKILEEWHMYCTQCGARSYRNDRWWNCPNRHKVKQEMRIKQPLVFDQCPKCFSTDVEKDEYLGLWPKSFTEKGSVSTGEADQIQCLYEVAKYDDQKRLIALPGKEDQTRFILDNRTYKKMTKIVGYTKTIRKFLRPDQESGMDEERLRWLIYNYLIHWTATGRIATRDFSLHTAPAKSDIRRLFVSRWRSIGGLILSADYSQLELRILACLADDEAFRQAFRDGKDIHREVAARVFKKIYEEVTDALRRYAKSCSFGIVYGETAASLAEKTGLTVQEAEDILNGIKYREFPGIGRFIDSKHKEAMETGGIRTVEGRIFHLPDVYHSIPSFVNAALRQAQNYPIQSPASDLTARVCIAHHAWYRKKRLLSRAWGFVHDAVESDIYPGELMPYMHALAYQMQDGIPNSLPYIRDAHVPLVAEFELATRWDGGVKIKKFGTDWLEVEGSDRFFKETCGSLFMCYPEMDIEVLSEKVIKKTDEIVLRKSYEGDDGGDTIIKARLNNLVAA